MINENPYIDQHTHIQGMFTRKFSPHVHSNDLVWHRDTTDRVVRVVKGNGWMFQFDESIPFVMIPNESMIFIPAMTYHRIIKGKNELILRIFEEK